MANNERLLFDFYLLRIHPKLEPIPHFPHSWRSFTHLSFFSHAHLLRPPCCLSRKLPPRLYLLPNVEIISSQFSTPCTGCLLILDVTDLLLKPAKLALWATSPTLLTPFTNTHACTHTHTHTQWWPSRLFWTQNGPNSDPTGSFRLGNNCCHTGKHNNRWCHSNCVVHDNNLLSSHFKAAVPQEEEKDDH